ncbi:MAG: leucine-rich repeat protein [Coriobacteriales bacterium]|jgi:hypothetical protein
MLQRQAYASQLASGQEEFVVRFAPDGGVCIERCVSTDSSITVPETISGYPVTEIGEYAFSGLAASRIVCAKGISRIGKHAFSNCKNLTTLVLPDRVDTMETGWIEGCTALAQLTLPGSAPSLQIGYTSTTPLRAVCIGRGTASVKIAHFESTLIEHIEVAEGNPWLSSDGTCLYDASGEVLLHCATNVEHCTVAESCRKIAPRAFAYDVSLKEVELPEGLVEIGERAFVGCALETVTLPSTVRRIDERAFSNCHKLKSIELNDGLEEIGDLAFSGCENLQAARIPSTVRTMSIDAFNNSKLLTNRGLSIDGRNARYFLDDDFVLYECGNDGLVLMKALDDVAGTYHVKEGTRIIGKTAFSHCNRLEAVELPAGLERIEKCAFMCCGSLSHLEIPKSLEWIGARAFFGTRLERLDLPAGLDHLGTRSMMFYDEMREYDSFPIREIFFGEYPQSKKSRNRYRGNQCTVTIDSDNKRFCIVSDFLCERMGDDKLLAIKYVGKDSHIVVPRQVTRIAENALAGASMARQLDLHDGIEYVESYGLYISHALDRIKIDMSRVDESFSLYPPNNYYGVWAQNHANLGGPLDLVRLATDVDETLSRSLPGYDRDWRIVARLAHPCLLNPKLRDKLVDEIAERLMEVVFEFSKRNYSEGITHLLDAGLIDARNICGCVEAANRANGVAVTGLLMDEEHRRFSGRGFDLAL